MVSWPVDGQESVEASPEAVAAALASFRRGSELFRSDEFDAALRLFLEVLGRLGFPLDQPIRDAAVSVIPDLRFTETGPVLGGKRSDRMVAGALFALGEGLIELGAEDGGFAAWDQLVACFGESDDRVFRKVVASSWMKRMQVLLRAKDFPAVAVALRSALGYEEFRRQKPPVQMLGAFLELAGELNGLGRVDEELEVYDDAVRLYADSDDPEVRAWVQTADVKKAFRLGQLGRMEEANATYAAVTGRYGTIVEALVERVVAGDLACLPKASRRGAQVSGGEGR